MYLSPNVLHCVQAKHAGIDGETNNRRGELLFNRVLQKPALCKLTCIVASAIYAESLLASGP